MSEFKGKKGPWSWVGGVLCNESYIVGRFESPPSSEDKALIAAAPELLEALQWAMRKIGSYTQRTSSNQTYCDQVDKANAAIAKALGR
jgi:hypothetical protein